jgi:hypothetical protein
MTILPQQITDVMRLYTRVAKMRPSALLNREPATAKDIVNISDEAKKQQILSQAKNEVLATIRGAK